MFELYLDPDSNEQTILKNEITGEICTLTNIFGDTKELLSIFTCVIIIVVMFIKNNSYLLEAHNKLFIAEIM